MGDSTPLSELTEAMSSRGYVYVQRASDDWLMFQGTMGSPHGDLPARIEVDPRGRGLPRIQVKLPESAPAILAHVGSSGIICYAIEGAVVLDVFDIPGQTLACLDRAKDVLEGSLLGRYSEDLEDEFFAYWGGDDWCFLDVETSDAAQLQVIFPSRGSDIDKFPFITSNPERTRSKMRTMGIRKEQQAVPAAFRVKTSAKPRPLRQGDWPPKTLSALLQWQGLLDPLARRKIESRLLTMARSGYAGLVCVVDSPLSQYAFGIALPETCKGVSTQRLRVELYAAKVSPLNVLSVSDTYINGRNNPGRPTLAGKRVGLLGCGTIGGYLAELLVKAGAGTGRGSLSLVDPDYLMPHNIGRHRLGFNRVLRNKATALKDELLQAAPGVDIVALEMKAEEVDLRQFDLVINATGEEALGHHLTKTSYAKGEFVPTLSVWVEGPGIGVRALMRDKSEQACTRCLLDSRRQARFPVALEEIPMTLAGQGCESLYVPFPASVSVQAACLAMEMVSDWLSSNSSPRLRTRMSHREFTNATGDADIDRLESCPACSS